MVWRPRRLLLATDFSPGARAAAEAAASIARRTGATTDLVHVLDPRPAAALVSGGLSELRHSVGSLAAQREHACDRLRALAAECGLSSYDVHIVSGEPVAELCVLGEKLKVDLRILGARAGRLRRFTLGSVTDALLHRPGSPLLVVNEPAPGGEFKRILVGLEELEARRWLEIALGLAHGLYAELLVLHVLPPLGHVSDRRHVVLEPERLPAAIEDLVARLDRTVPIEVVIDHGDPTHVIPLVARKRAADLVVIGAERQADGWPGEVAEQSAEAGLPALLVVWPD